MPIVLMKLYYNSITTCSNFTITVLYLYCSYYIKRADSGAASSSVPMGLEVLRRPRGSFGQRALKVMGYYGGSFKGLGFRVLGFRAEGQQGFERDFRGL